jgi:hypothetical protein
MRRDRRKPRKKAISRTHLDEEIAGVDELA